MERRKTRIGREMKGEEGRRKKKRGKGRRKGRIFHLPPWLKPRSATGQQYYRTGRATGEIRHCMLRKKTYGAC